MKIHLNKTGLCLSAGSILLLILLFVGPYFQAVVRIPSPEYEAVRRFYWWIMVFGCGFLVLAALVLFFVKKISFWHYPLGLMILGLFYMLVFPTFSAPDEAAHFTSAYRLSSYFCGKMPRAGEEFLSGASEEERKRVEKGADVLVRKADDVAGFSREIGRSSYKLALTEMFSVNREDGLTVRGEIPVNIWPVVYLPQALGISAARVLGLGYVPLVYLGRLFNLMFFVFLSALSVRLMPFKKEILMAVSALPMTLHLAGSLSYDPVFIGLSMLLGAWCFHLAFARKRVGWKDVLILALLLVLLEPGKLVYLPAAGICMMIPASRFSSKRSCYLSRTFLVIAVMIAVYLANRSVLSAWALKTEKAVAWTQGTGYTLQDVVKYPGEVLSVFLETLFTQSGFYLGTMLGMYLGNLDTNLAIPSFCLFLLGCVLVAGAVRREGERTYLMGKQKLWISLLVFLSAGLILVSMFLGWTPKDLGYIAGVQGRYFLPLLPLVLFLFFDKGLTVSWDLRKEICFLECFVNIYVLIRICAAACLRY